MDSGSQNAGGEGAHDAQRRRWRACGVEEGRQEEVNWCFAKQGVVGHKLLCK